MHAQVHALTIPCGRANVSMWYISFRKPLLFSMTDTRKQAYNFGRLVIKVDRDVTPYVEVIYQDSEKNT